MGIRLISENCYSVKTRNKNGEMLRTDVYQFENGVFQAYSFYANDEDEVIVYSADPELIFEKWQNRVDAVIDGGFGANVASTIIDLTGSEPEVIREGLGSIDIF